MRTLTIRREPYLTAPEGIAVYHQNPAYTRAAGGRLVEAVKHEAVAFDPAGPFFYHPRIFRRYSDDHGRCWTPESPDFCVQNPDWDAGAVRTMPIHVLDPRRDRLICLYATHEFDRRQAFMGSGNRRSRTWRLFYQVSGDGGDSWAAARQVIDERAGHDALHYAPGIEYGVRGVCADLGSTLFLPDGRLLVALSLSNAPAPADAVGPLDAEGYTAALCVRGAWTDDGADRMRWRFSQWVFVPPSVSVRGAQEPAITALDGQRVFMTLRCQGDERFGIVSSRQTSLSQDGGMTWSATEPLRYDDGAVVHTPASLSRFVTSGRTGETCFIGNILDRPVHGQTPRYPLCLAEFDRRSLRIRRDTVRAVIDRPPDAPLQRRYTNWGQYEDRETGELVLTLPEQPRDMDFSAMTRPDQFTADSIRLRIGWDTPSVAGLV